VNTDTESRWLTMPEAIALSGLSRWTLTRRIEDGSLRAARVGPRLIQVEAASLDALRVPYTPA
jgi:predicted DNA-binding transcriptional regulator AlpA